MNRFERLRSRRHGTGLVATQTIVYMCVLNTILAATSPAPPEPASVSPYLILGPYGLISLALSLSVGLRVEASSRTLGLYSLLNPALIRP